MAAYPDADLKVYAEGTLKYALDAWDASGAALKHTLDAWDARQPTPTPTPTRLVIHMDINGTIMLTDSTKDRTIDQALNGFLASKYGADDLPWPAKGLFTETEAGAAHRDELTRLHAAASALAPHHHGILPAYLAAATVWASMAPRVCVVLRTFGRDVAAVTAAHAACGLPPIAVGLSYSCGELLEHGRVVEGGLLAWLEAHPDLPFVAVQDDYAHWQATEKREGKLLHHSDRHLQLFFDDNHGDPIVWLCGEDCGTTKLVHACTADILTQPLWFCTAVLAALTELLDDKLMAEVD